MSVGQKVFDQMTCNQQSMAFLTFCLSEDFLLFLEILFVTWDRIFSHVWSFYEWAVSDLDRSRHRSVWVKVAHSSCIEGSHTWLKIRPQVYYIWRQQYDCFKIVFDRSLSDHSPHCAGHRSWAVSESSKWHHDTQHYDIQHNDIQHNAFEYYRKI